MSWYIEVHDGTKWYENGIYGIYWYIPVCTGMYHLYCPVQSCTHSTSGNRVPTCTILYCPVPVLEIWYLLVPSCTVLYLYRKSGSDLYCLVQSCTNSENPVLTCTVLYQNIEIWHRLVPTCTGLYQTAKSCTCLYRLVPVHTSTYRYIPICPSLSRYTGLQVKPLLDSSSYKQLYWVPVSKKPLLDSSSYKIILDSSIKEAPAGFQQL